MTSILATSVTQALDYSNFPFWCNAKVLLLVLNPQNQAHFCGVFFGGGSLPKTRTWLFVSLLLISLPFCFLADSQVRKPIWSPVKTKGHDSSKSKDILSDTDGNTKERAMSMPNMEYSTDGYRGRRTRAMQVSFVFVFIVTALKSIFSFSLFIFLLHHSLFLFMILT